MEWGEAARTVDPKILHKLAEVVCKQQWDCDGSAACAYCHDCAENVIGEYLILTGQVK